MMNKIPYEQTFTDYGYRWIRCYPTGKCKKFTVKDKDDNVIFGADYAQVWVRFLGINLWTRWVNKKHIEWRSETIEYYDCNNDPYKT